MILAHLNSLIFWLKVGYLASLLTAGTSIWRSRSISQSRSTVFVRQWIERDSLPPCCVCWCGLFGTEDDTHTHTQRQQRDTSSHIVPRCSLFKFSHIVFCSRSPSRRGSCGWLSAARFAENFVLWAVSLSRLSHIESRSLSRSRLWAAVGKGGRCRGRAALWAAVGRGGCCRARAAVRCFVGICSWLAVLFASCWKLSSREFTFVCCATGRLRQRLRDFLLGSHRPRPSPKKMECFWGVFVDVHLIFFVIFLVLCRYVWLIRFLRGGLLNFFSLGVLLFLIRKLFCIVTCYGSCYGVVMDLFPYILQSKKMWSFIGSYSSSNSLSSTPNIPSLSSPIPSSTSLIYQLSFWYIEFVSKWV